MIFFTFLTFIVFNLSSVSTCVKERHCNFSRYMLNYFTHNKQYLLHINETLDKISEEDLKKYGEAIQTHGEIVLLMIQELYYLKCDYLPRDLMAVNLYLNNVSGSVSIISRKISVKNTKENKKLQLLKGYQMIHEHISNQLSKYINTWCADEVVSLFVDYPKINDEHSELNIEKLVFVTKDLRNKIMKELNTDLCTDSFTQLFSPKNVIYYDLLTHQSIENEKNFMNGSQRRQIKADIKNDYLDLLRFTPLNIQCADGSDITLSDVFRFIKFNFNHRHVYLFQTLVSTSLFYPVFVLLGKFANLILSLSTSDLNASYYNKNICRHIILLTRTVIESLNKINDLNIFNDLSYKFVFKIVNRLKHFLNSAYHWPIINENYNIIFNIHETLKNTLINKGIRYEIEPTITITQDNFYGNYKIVFKYSMQVKNYIVQLKKHNNLIISQNSLHKKMKHSNYTHKKDVLTDNVVENLCKDDFYKTFNRTYDLDEIEDDLVNDVQFADLGFVKIETSLSSIQNEASIDSNETKLEIETTDSSKYSPCYTYDYIMYK
ncbi:uncharacterized protein LOC126907521 [Daktulosphaira vitifoliae]|uniref:uncharacterized protein LOC126907521 n=1 Tax=Daktulosphaira vitifoliae TaxID=58002 RepID=UPI0021AA56CB|nr:uncharacterized protein LOC126907521 [Daktulosphaira vitifoliae]